MASFVINGKQNISMQTKIQRTSSENKNKGEPAPLERRNWLIYLHYVRGDYGLCQKIVEKELERTKGRHEYAYFIKGTMLKDEERIQESLDAFQMCYKLNPENIDNIKQVANCLYLLRRYRLALEAYLEAEGLATKPDWEIYYHLGECLLKLREPAKALEYVRRATQVGHQERPFQLLTKMLITAGDYNSAINVCNAALEACPESTDLLTELGLLHIRIGQSQLAFERLGSALALKPSSDKALLAVGCIMQNHCDFDVALSKYRIAAQFAPESAALWSNIGMCLYAKQKHIGAISCLLHAVWLSPLNWRILYNLGLVSLKTQQPASAFHFLCAAVNLRPDYGPTFMLLGIALRQLEDPENALKAFMQAVELSPKDPVILTNGSVCLYEAGRLSEAAKMMTSFQKIVDEIGDINDEVLTVANHLNGLLPKESVGPLSDTALTEAAAFYSQQSELTDPDEV